MFYCKSCGSVFSQAEHTKNGKYVCPDCGSQKFESATQCPICHEYFVSDNSYDKYCPDCVMNAEDQLRSAVEKWVDPDYIELLKDEYLDFGCIMGDNDG